MKNNKKEIIDPLELSCLNTILLNIAAAIPTAMVLQEYLIKEDTLTQFLSCALIHHMLLTIGRFIILGEKNSHNFGIISYQS